MAKGHDMDEVPVSSGNDRVKPSDVVDLYKFPSNKFVKLRFYGPIFAYGGHWVETLNKEGKKTKFFTPCAAFDHDTGQIDSTKECAWCSDTSGSIKASTEYYSNAILRSDQKNEPEKIKPSKAEAASGLKDKDSDTWTPVKAIRLTPSVLRRLRDLRQLNTHENEDGDSVNYAVSHPKFGCDVSIKYSPDASPAQMYEVQLGSHAPIRKSERAYLAWDLSALMDPLSEKDAKTDYDRWAKKMGLTSDDEDEDEDDRPKKKKKVPTGKDKSRSDNDFDEDDDEDEPKPKKKSKKIVDEDDDEDEAPKSKKKPKKVVDEDEDDDLYGDDDDEDEPKSKKKSKKVVDDEDFEDEEDEPKPKKKGKKVVDEDDEDFEDEDEEPKPKKKGKKVVEDDDEEDEPKPKKKGKKVVDEDEDDEEPKPKKKSKKVVDEDDEDEEPKPKKKSKKVVDEDEDDEDF